MTGYLGTAARMIPVAPSTAQVESSPARFEVRAAPSRRWAFDTSRPNGSMPRSWDVDLSVCSPGEVSRLVEFMHGQWGRGPFRWVSCAAHSVNVLTPAQSALAGVRTVAGDLVDGWSPLASAGPLAATLAESVTVLPGGPVSVGLDLQGGSMVLTWRNAAGGSVGVSTVAGGPVMGRVSWSGTAPVSARSVDIEVSGHALAGRPQVAWAPALPPFMPGMGSVSVVVESGAVQPVYLGGPQSYWAGSVRITEVG